MYIPTLVPVDIKREKREVPNNMTPINATVEMVFMIDFATWSKFSSPDLAIQGVNDSTLSVLLYFAHVAEMVNTTTC